jgi:fucose permease
MVARFGAKRVFLAGFLCAILGALSVFFMPSLWTVTASLFFIFAGFGFFEVGINALATQVFTNKAALLMSLLHFFYGIGAIAGPRAAGILTNTGGLQWRTIYLLTIPLSIIFLVSTIAARFPERSADKAPEDRGNGGLSFIGALRLPMTWTFAISLGLMVVVEMSFSNWGGIYFQDVYGLDPKTAGAAFISTFFIVFSISRLLSGFVIEKLGYMRSLIGANICIIFILILGFSLGARGVLVLPLAGFFIGIFWPTHMAVAMGYFGKDAPVVTSAMIVISGLLNTLAQYLIGIFSRMAGAAWGYRSCLAYAAVLLVMLIFLNRKTQQKRTR